MFRSVIAIAALMASISASAGETPTQFMERYVGYFNAEDSEQYQEMFEFPVIRSVGGVLEILSDPSVPMANFENLRKTGWDTSRIGYVKVLSETPLLLKLNHCNLYFRTADNAYIDHLNAVRVDESQQ